MQTTTNHVLRKVPEITALFWVTKLLTTAMGESASDYVANTYNPYAAVLVAAVILTGALYMQFRAKRYSPAIYWFCVAMVAVFGTMAADVLHKQLGVAYVASSAFFAATLAAVFTVWYKFEGTLSIHSITSVRREIFYWLTVMTTFALGTAAGDWTANSLGFGYFMSGIVFALLMVVPITGYRLKLNEAATFWLAYILTRPFGASFADWFGKSPQVTGLGYGDGTVSLVLIFLIVGAVWYMMHNRPEMTRETSD